MEPAAVGEVNQQGVRSSLDMEGEEIHVIIVTCALCSVLVS